MKVVIIGGTGHVGTYLVPRLVEDGHKVTVVTRGQREPYLPHGAWQTVQKVAIDRTAEEQAGTFGQKIRGLKPDAVIDMICFGSESATHLVKALRGEIQHFLSCGTVWVHGTGIQVPITEDQPRCPIGEYGIQKAAMEAYLIEEARKNGFPATIVHPGHIVGCGWVPLNPLANFNPNVYVKLAKGEELVMPDQGHAILHHVYADDVAQVFMLALRNRNHAIGESFHAVSPSALTLKGYAESVALWFGQTAKLNFIPFNEWGANVSKTDSDMTREHLIHSPNCYSPAKAQRLLGYQPRYSSLQAIRESINWLIEHNVIHL